MLGNVAHDSARMPCPHGSHLPHLDLDLDLDLEQPFSRARQNTILQSSAPSHHHSEPPPSHHLLPTTSALKHIGMDNTAAMVTMYAVEPSGACVRGCTRRAHWCNGTPPSRAKAYSILAGACVCILRAAVGWMGVTTGKNPSLP
ncbi:hypothetical protein Vafri_14976 [Volvox africanus]|uniref:Uncharacterized protein n=1 Tax=Volvox africanus TaxID=51714 RepID=A0A8J4BGN9_9CHLO|nr:hypothetical protein Vafri_14976 [Volvox africanus]